MSHAKWNGLSRKFGHRKSMAGSVTFQWLTVHRQGDIFVFAVAQCKALFYVILVN